MTVRMPKGEYVRVTNKMVANYSQLLDKGLSAGQIKKQLGISWEELTATRLEYESRTLVPQRRGMQMPFVSMPKIYQPAALVKKNRYTKDETGTIKDALRILAQKKRDHESMNILKEAAKAILRVKGVKVPGKNAIDIHDPTKDERRIILFATRLGLKLK